VDDITEVDPVPMTVDDNDLLGDGTGLDYTFSDDPTVVESDDNAGSTATTGSDSGSDAATSGSGEGRRRRLEATGEAKILFTSDESVAYVPDNEENSEGFDLEVPEDPVTGKDAVSYDDEGESSGGVKTKRFIMIGLVVVVVILIIFIICMCKRKGGEDKEQTPT
jgi:hypothetical protein